MVKKIFSAVLILGVMLFSNFATAAENPRADKNFMLFYQHQGYQYFLKKSTLTLENAESPYIISFKYIVFDSIQPKNTNWDKVNQMAFAYDVDSRKVYFAGPNGELTFLNPAGTVAEGSGYAYGAEKIFYFVFGEKFYGTYDEDFYNSVDN